MPSILIVK